MCVQVTALKQQLSENDINIANLTEEVETNAAYKNKVRIKLTMKISD